MISNVTCFLAGLILAIGLSGRAGDFLLEYGQCRFGQAENGTYYDEKLNHRNYLSPRCASFGYHDKFGSIGYRVALIVAGSVEGRDNVAQMNDGVYDPNPCSNEHWANCHSQFGGSGRMKGIALSLTKDWDLGQWWLRGEAGLLFFEHHFKGYAKPQDFDGAPMVNGGHVGGTAVRWEGGGLDQSSSLTDNPIPLVGMTLGYKRVYMAFRYHFPASHRPGLSITDHSFTQITAGVKL